MAEDRLLIVSSGFKKTQDNELLLVVSSVGQRLGEEQQEERDHLQ